MNKQKIINLIPLISYILVEVILFLLFVIPSIIKNVGTPSGYTMPSKEFILVTKFLTVGITLLFSIGATIYAYKKQGATFKDQLFVSSALVFTIIADIFLFILDNYYEIGVVSFIIAQLLYFLRMLFVDKVNRLAVSMRVLFRLTIIAILLAIALFNIKPFSLLIFEACVYFGLLICNFIDAFINIFMNKENRKSYIVFALGLLLFIGCDICVGLANLGENTWDYIWMFYTPSQVLIMLSSLGLYNFGMKKYEKE